jgi:hypothetical protein
MSVTHYNQTKVLTTWFLNHLLDEYIDNKKHEVWIQDTWSTARRPKSQRKAKDGHLKEGEAAKPTSGMKSSKTKERAKKSSKSNPSETNFP